MRSLFFITLLFFCSMQMPSAQPLGRLFFTPAERLALEQQRHNKTAAVVQSGGNITVNGFIQKHGTGKTMVWINDSPQNEIPHEKNSKQYSVPVIVPSTGQSIDVKVGQTLDMDSGSVAETSQVRRKSRQEKKLGADPGEQKTLPENAR